ncbi:hypothetical protein AB0I72_27325 [Nocardiopsis sp. NPDC049922]|uniref:hypothetical protein n=1 Tax=Nocardiopsis sp. NPDC049922 TaxID=3155157 RepID=UPI0033DDC8DB
MKLKTAENWAKAIVANGQDIDYSPDHEGEEVSPFGGFKLTKADPKAWFLKDLLRRV